MLEMINVELDQIEGIQKEVDAGVISVEDIQNRYDDKLQKLFNEILWPRIIVVRDQHLIYNLTSKSDLVK